MTWDAVVPLTLEGDRPSFEQPMANSRVVTALRPEPHAGLRLVPWPGTFAGLFVVLGGNAFGQTSGEEGWRNPSGFAG
ncbi:hypothetical protein GCM10009863_67510 [Streptomyces axinellae]|uniref:Uncharacterized protein n=1 Tax=Streptomyces axinellae TaxID=552788 RepID=A0ABP6DBQ9_9ACTN